MRGTHVVGHCRAHWTGIIPAYAGNTFHDVLRLSAIEDHPRVCGEHLTAVQRLLEEPGSSPRMRGTH